MADLDRKVAVVTGAGGGIGAASASILAAAGASVIVADINLPAAQSVAKQIAADGGSATAYQVDVESEDQIKRMIATAVDTYGGIDILHNNAALTAGRAQAGDGPISDLDITLLEQVMRVNLGGYALGAKYAIPRMIERGGGVVINTSSTDALLAELVRGMYGMSKAAINALTRTIATQYGRQGIRSVGVAPGVIVTPGARASVPADMLARQARHDVTPRSGIPEDIGHLVAFLASDKAGFITGITIQVDGGLTAHFPNYADEIDALTSGR